MSDGAHIGGKRGPRIVREVHTAAGHEQRTLHETGVPGFQVTDKWVDFARMAQAGELPDLGEVPELPPEVLELAKWFHIIKLPEWKNPAGRVMAPPGTVQVAQAIRIAQYFYECGGLPPDPDRAVVRWYPTPGGPPALHDQGKHVYRALDEEFPAPDPEEFYDIGDVSVVQEERTGKWSAHHPRGIGFTADSKSAAWAGIADLLRKKIIEAQQTAAAAAESEAP